MTGLGKLVCVSQVAARSLPAGPRGKARCGIRSQPGRMYPRRGAGGAGLCSENERGTLAESHSPVNRTGAALNPGYSPILKPLVPPSLVSPGALQLPTTAFHHGQAVANFASVPV